MARKRSCVDVSFRLPIILSRSRNDPDCTLIPGTALRHRLASGLSGVACLAVLVQLGGSVVADSWPIGPDACLHAPFADAATAAQAGIRDLVDGLRPALSEFPSLSSLLETGSTHICLAERLVTEKAYLDAEADRIVLSADMSPGLMRVVLVHELRHAEQLARGVCPSLNLAMREYARGVLALEADANVTAALVAWREKDAGDGQMWQALESWPMTGDIAVRFAAVMAETGDVAEAASAAFDQWYASESRTNLYYITSCSAYLDQQDEVHALPGYLRLADDYLARLCLLPDGTDYACSDAHR